MRWAVIAGALGAGLAAAMGAASDAHACGGCFHGPSQNPDVITDHRMIFRVSPQETTLYDEIEYQGDPSSFAWVLPIKGPVTVGLSADIVFSAFDSATQTSIQSPNLPPCQTCSCGNFGGAGSSSGGSSGGGKAADAGAVTVISQQVVGPYESVQLQSTDPNALTDWLTANGFTIPSGIDTIIAAYVQEGFDFLALKLQPGQGVNAMRPVRVSTPGAGLTLPLRMVSAGTGPTVGITLWVVGDGRYEAANFPNFTIQASQLVWDWNTESSNYTTLVQQTEQAANDATWQTESSLDVSAYQIESPVLADQASDDYLPIAASDAGTGDDGGGSAGETADQVRQDDLATLFPGGNQGTVRVTRMRADLSHAALATDLNLQASADQSNVSNFYQVTQSVNAPTCPPITTCPPCGGSSSGVSSSGASGSGSGSSSGINEGTGGNTTTKTVSSGSSSFGCAASPEGGSGGWLEAGLAAFVGIAFARSRRRRPRP